MPTLAEQLAERFQPDVKPVTLSDQLAERFPPGVKPVTLSDQLAERFRPAVAVDPEPAPPVAVEPEPTIAVGITEPSADLELFPSGITDETFSRQKTAGVPIRVTFPEGDVSPIPPRDLIEIPPVEPEPPPRRAVGITVPPEEESLLPAGISGEEFARQAINSIPRQFDLTLPEREKRRPTPPTGAIVGITAKEAVGTRRAISSALNSFGQRIVKSVGAAFKLIPVTAIGLTKKIGEFAPSIQAAIEESDRALGASPEAENRTLFKVGQKISDFGEFIFPTEEGLRGDFFYDVLPSVAGDFAGSVLTRSVAGKLKASKTASVAFFAGTQNGVALYDEAKSFGATDEDATSALGLGFGMGMLDVVPVERVFRRFDEASGRVASRRLIKELSKRVTKGEAVPLSELQRINQRLSSGTVFTAENLSSVAIQTVVEGMQTVGGNKVAQELFDENRNLFAEAGKSAAAGGVVSTAALFLAAMMGAKLRRGKPTSFEGLIPAELMEQISKDVGDIGGLTEVEVAARPAVGVEEALAVPQQSLIPEAPTIKPEPRMATEIADIREGEEIQARQSDERIAGVLPEVREMQARRKAPAQTEDALIAEELAISGQAKADSPKASEEFKSIASDNNAVTASEVVEQAIEKQQIPLLAVDVLKVRIHRQQGVMREAADSELTDQAFLRGEATALRVDGKGTNEEVAQRISDQRDIDAMFVVTEQDASKKSPIVSARELQGFGLSQLESQARFLGIPMKELTSHGDRRKRDLRRLIAEQQDLDVRIATAEVADLQVEGQNSEVSGAQAKAQVADAVAKKNEPVGFNFNTDRPATQSDLDQLRDAIDVALKARKTKDIEINKSRKVQAKRLILSQEKGGGDAAVRRELAILSGALSKEVMPPVKINDDVRDRLLDHIASSKDLVLPFSRANARIALRKMLDHGEIPAPSSLRYIEIALGDGATRSLQDVQNGIQSGVEGSWPQRWAANVLGSSKALITSGDISFTFRQGALVWLVNPEVAGQSFSAQLNALVSESAQLEADAKMRAEPLFPLAEQAKIDFTDTLLNKEEPYVNAYINNVPIVGIVTKASERAYVTMANQMRMGMFKYWHNEMQKTGTDFSTPEGAVELELLGDWINNITGRGPTLFKGENAKFWSSILFSERFLTSRFKSPVLTAKMLRSKNPALRKLAIRATVRPALALASMWGLTKLAADVFGWDTEFSLDPFESDFGKIRVGDTRFDMGAGYGQAFRLVVGMTTFHQRDPRTGKLKLVDPTKVLHIFSRNKLAPIPGTLARLGAGRFHEDGELQLGKVMSALTLPINVQGLMESIDEEIDPLNAGGMFLIDSLGIGVNTYKTGKPVRLKPIKF